MTGLENAFVLDIADGRFWTTQPDLHRRMFVGDVHGGTLMFRRQLWVDGLRYPDLNLAEDAWFVDRVRKHGRRLLRLANRGVFVYMRHGHNTWKECVPGRFINPGGWEPVAAPPGFPVGVLATYQAAVASNRTAQGGT